MKKKITLTVTALVLVAALSTMAAFAAGNGSRGFVDTDNDGVCDNRGSGNGNFVDADNDGICDNQGNGYGNFVDADNDGTCDNRGNGNFVDADNDGVCDNRGTGMRPQDGTGRQWGRNK